MIPKHTLAAIEIFDHIHMAMFIQEIEQQVKKNMAAWKNPARDRKAQAWLAIEKDHLQQRLKLFNTFGDLTENVRRQLEEILNEEDKIFAVQYIHMNRN